MAHFQIVIQPLFNRTQVTELSVIGSNNEMNMGHLKTGFVFCNLTLQRLHFTHCRLNVFSRDLIDG